MVRIIIAAHKKTQLPKDDIYLPVFVGAAMRDGAAIPGYVPDNQGDQISAKNPMYSELTGLYYAWKNLGADTLGLVHYRRYFEGKRHRKAAADGKTPEAFRKVLCGEELQSILEKSDIVLPKKQHYYIETIYSHYAHTHDSRHLDVTREIIREKYPEYTEAFDRVMKARSAHMFNMMIMKEPYLSVYCAWLFDILGELEKRFRLEENTDYQRRYIGRIAEILINVWLDRSVEEGRIARERIAVLPVIYFGKINWVRKGSAFLKAKFLHRRYQESF